MADSRQGNPLVLVWVTNVASSPDLYIEFSTDPLASRNFLYEAINSDNNQISHGNG